jgi:DHA2 family multidrug resistance protein-like MFS transporter
MAVGFAVLATAGAVALPAVVAGTVIFSVGLAPAYILTTDLVVSTVRPERARMAAAVTETGTELGGALGIAVLGSVGVAAYRHELPGALVDALTRAASLPPGAASSLRPVAEHAYSNAFVLMSAMAAVVVAVAALLAAVFLRPAPAAGPAASSPTARVRSGPAIDGVNGLRTTACRRCPGRRRLRRRGVVAGRRGR